MNRRSFISGLIRVGACVAFDPHRVIFDMGRKLFLPEHWSFISEPISWGKSVRAFTIIKSEGLDRIAMAEIVLRRPIDPAFAA